MLTSENAGIGYIFLSQKQMRRRTKGKEHFKKLRGTGMCWEWSHKIGVKWNAALPVTEIKVTVFMLIIPASHFALCWTNLPTRESS